MSLFTKRKGRRISTFEDEDEPASGSGAPPSDDDPSSDPVVQPIRFGKRQLKQSALRRSINVNDDDGGLGGTDADESSGPTTADEEAPKLTGGANDNEEEGPVVVRPGLGRSGSRRNKKRLSTASTSSRLSFGGGLGGGDDDDGGDDSGPVVVTPNKRGAGSASSLTQRVLETNAFRKSLSGRLPTRHRAPDDEEDDKDEAGGKGPSGYDDDDDRPRYSQAYLDELQSSTPNTPQNLSSLRRKNGIQDNGDNGEVMDLDPSELDGAMVVDESELGFSSAAAETSSALSTGLPAPAAKVLTETEIQERKDRRARRALEGDYDPDADDEENGEYISLLTDEQKEKKREKERTRLVREDEDLGEGYDEFVEDKEALSIGRKAERAARKKRKEEMAALINAAEMGDDAAGGEGGAANDNGDDSEAERRAAYDAAQTRAGMEGLHHRTRNGNGDDDGDLVGGVHGTVPIPRMRALPDLTTCLKLMQSAVEALEVDAAQHRRKLNEVEQEKAEITAREAEVQAVLDAAAAKYQTVLGGNPATAATATTDPTVNNTQSPLRSMPALGQSPLRALPPGLTGDYPVQRGLESLGTTPTRRPHPDDVFGV
ncbi:hypothetical protein SBRCBS47491_007436 [Sporothrix bragantina]|uniref:Nineteen complex-related protein 2-domain-containing protein n=1 Tax=Sporothrix bragantina TaxID=671064 RepID=A0ABP0CD57_9PEZI